MINNHFQQWREAFIYQTTRTLLGVTLSYFVISPVIADDDIGLNLEFLQGGRNTLAADFLTTPTAYYPGRYVVDVLVNSISIGKRVLTITPEEQHQICFSREWLASIDIYIRPEFYQAQYQTAANCYVLGEQPNTQVSFDISTQTLSLAIPQAGLTKADESLDWGFGNNALRLNYNINANKYRDNVDYYGSSSLLTNVGEWIARGSASITQDEQSVSVFTLSKAILSLQADVILGKTSVSSGELGGLSTYGMTLSSNANMRRQTLGYTPIFSGIANSNARVTLRQGNTVLYSEIVPPGPFEINDVTVLNGGDVVMTITENNGEVLQQIFPITLIRGQISPGEHEYSVSVGVIDHDNARGTPTGALGAISYGYGLKHLSLRLGSLVGGDFTGVTGEVTSQLGSIGSVSTAISATQSRYDEGDRNGQKSTFTYAKTFDTGTSIRASLNQMSENYDTLGEYNDENYEYFSRRQPLKNEVSLGFSQPLWMGANVSVNTWERRYWHREDKQRGMTSNLSTRVGKIGISVAGAYYKTGQDDQYNISTSVSIPFSIFEHNYNSFASMSSSKEGKNNYSAGVSTNITDRWSMAISESWSTNGNLGDQTNVWSTYDGRMAQYSGQISRAKYGTTGSASMNGALMYLPADNSFILGKNISDTVAVVHIPGATGSTLLGGLDKTDRNGNLIVPIRSYQVNTLSIDTSTLPSNTEIAMPSLKIRPTASSVTYVPFDALQVKRYLLQVRRTNGQFISAGEWAFSETGAPLGFVSNNGVLLINTVDALGTLRFSDCRVPAAQLTESNRLQEVICEI